MVTGRVHSVESCGTFDGPGIRFIVFMQGCLMRCKYCHNRDSWDEDAGDEMTVEQVLEQVRPYKHFFKSSGGGITVSGGEPILQAEFVTALFTACKQEGIHTTLDTNGFIRGQDEKMDALMQVTDLVLLDLKQIQDKIHIDLTKVSNRYALSFARHLQKINKPVWIRYVVVPGYTDDQLSAQLLAEFLHPMDNVVHIELLPYHSIGAYKWQQYGDTYELAHIHPPSQLTMQQLKKTFNIYGLKVVL
ncbi:pyruvate formate lyase 1-activating protein [Thalassotalea sp. HSM 43]|uniref:pyruvate formate lyase 1-activating protein n=1 Tax=Thalassotalea sp. HSM 43 TaxID=2552945 RepID=UPI0010808388|nr:pyruvate formate lyase 1-activating protein [Thalassotalea sp. HSM 43]QBY04927.1 pyruvate formate lyase 1-activating protein [Thalassotalea sp. HSM 43]